MISKGSNNIFFNHLSHMGKISVLDPVLNSHTFLNDLAELATISEFLENTNLGRDFKRKYQRKYTDQESKKRPLSVIWQEAGLKFYDSKNHSIFYFEYP